MKPIIKWPGGKEKELDHILSNLPPRFASYYEPFVGGGSVFAAIEANHSFINDKSDELCSLYRNIACKNQMFFDSLKQVSVSWNAMREFAAHTDALCGVFMSYRKGAIDRGELARVVDQWLNDKWAMLVGIIPRALSFRLSDYRNELQKNLVRKLLRMRQIEEARHMLPEQDVRNNIATALMSSLYMYYRGLYNDAAVKSGTPEIHNALFVFIRNFTYSGMFRYNANGEFNVPYGGMAYNSKSMDPKIDYYLSDGLGKLFSGTSIDNLDFEEFLKKHAPGEHDFIFLDPPYDTEFSTYAENDFTREDHERLANYLCHDCKAKWMMIIKKTDFILSLYEGHGLHISSFDKKYQVSFMNRNDREVMHLMITNYEPCPLSSRHGTPSQVAAMLPGFD